MDGDKSKQRYELVPPDGGWAYMIWIAVVIHFSASMMFLPCMGMIFNDLYLKLGMGSTDIQVVNGISAMFVAIGSFAAGPMMKVLSMRKLSFMGAASMSIGVFALVFVNSYALLILCQGILLGTGVGLCYNVTCTSLNNYFLKKRFIITSLAQTLSAAAATVTPLAVHWCLEYYGFRGTLVFMAAVYMQTLVGSALQQPVKWHMKRVPVKHEVVELLETKNGDDMPNTETFQVVDINIDHIVPAKSKSALVYMKDVFDWPFLKQFLRTCVCVGAPLSVASDVMFTLFVPQYLYVRGWKQKNVARALSLLSLGDIATRILLIVGSAWLKNVGSDVLFIIGMAVDIVVKLVLLWFPHPIVTYTTLTLTGCSRCLLIVLFSLVISESVPPEKYATAFGVSSLIYGIISITIGPAIGAVRDATGDYTVMFYLLIAVMAAVTIAWCIEIYRNKKNKTQIKMASYSR